MEREMLDAFQDLIFEGPQIGTVQAVSYLGVRSPTEGHTHKQSAPRIKQLMVLATGAYLRPCTVQYRV